MPTNAVSSFYVPHNRFNEANYPTLIGRHFVRPPGYAQVRHSKLDSVEYLIAEQNVTTAVAIAKTKEIVERVVRAWQPRLSAGSL